MEKILILLSVLFAASCVRFGYYKPSTSEGDFSFKALSTEWDEAFPLGNGEIGELVWEKDGRLRLSLDHTDIWDLRSTSFESKMAKLNYQWVLEKVNAGNVDSIISTYDHPYDREVAPTKLPCAALEFPLDSFGKVSSAKLYLHDALCQIKWENGASLETFVNASEPVGWFVFRGLTDSVFVPTIVKPKYNSDTDAPKGIQNQIKLMELGYEQGEVQTTGNSAIYHQKGWGDFSYDVAVQWERSDDVLYGTWSISTSIKGGNATEMAANALSRGYMTSMKQHLQYWNSYWKASSVLIPNTVLQRQYEREMYKFGSASRENSSPISLQAIWTADNGIIPPWKGDYHNDLNTQLSYWPAYRGNHLSEGLAYLNFLWEQRETYRKYTSDFFGVDGVVVPGVASFDGHPLGGWSQYAMSSTVGAWCAQHFYLHWKYSADDDFLRERAYPFMKDVAIALDELSIKDSSGVRGLPLSTSPEMYGNSIEAWFRTITNFDLALMRFTFKAAAEMATALSLDEDASRWSECLSEMPEFDIDEDSALTIAKGFPYNLSHRHLSNAMAIFPLGLIDVTDEGRKIIKSTIDKFDKYGPDNWCGYTYSWLGNMKARALDGDGAAEALKIFAECFCLHNSFHVNGDQTRSGKSQFIDRLFTLEGNFAFASAIHEMLLQSHTGVVNIFPAIPSSWKDVSFSQLRARGAFLVSAKMQKGKIVSAEVYSEKGGPLDIMLSGATSPMHYDTYPGQIINLLK